MLPRRWAAVALLGLAACASARGAAPPAAPAGLAGELAPGAVAPVWATLPEATRKDLEAKVPRGNALEMARERLAKLSWSTDDEGRLRTAMRGYLEALFLLEPLAFGPEAEHRAEAETLLLRFWTAARLLPALVRVVEANGGVRGDAALDPSTLKLVGAAADRQSRHFAQRLLARPALEVLELTRFAAALESTEEPERALAVWRELSRRAPERLDARDWLGLATAAVAAGEPTEARQAMDRARALSVAEAPPKDEAARIDARKLTARFRAAERRLSRVLELRDRARGTDADAELAKADLLVETGRPTAGHARYQELAETYPTDGRIRARAAAALLWTAGEGVTVVEAATRAYDFVQRAPQPREDGELASLWVGLIGMKAKELFAEAGRQRDPGAFLNARIGPLLADYAAANAVLAKSDPGRAAVNAFVLRHLRELLGAAGADGLAKVAPGWVPEARKLLTTYPRTDDAHRVCYALAPFAGDEAEAMLSAVPASEDASLHLQRARVSSTMAAAKLTPAWIALARSSAEAIPETEDDDVEGQRAALRADALAIEAAATKSATNWPPIAELYGIAATSVKQAQRSRVLNNLGFALAAQGRVSGAETRWREAAATPSERNWVAQLNAAFAGTPDRSERLALVRQFEAAFDDAKRPVPALVHAWHAELADGAERVAEAKTTTALLATSPLAVPKRDLGLELEGAFKLGVGLKAKSRGHVFEASLDALVWLAPSPGLDPEALRKLAAGPAKKKR